MGDSLQQPELVKPGSIKRYIIIAVFSLVLIGLAVSGIVINQYVTDNLASVSSDTTAVPVSVSIPKGASTAQIGQILAEAKLIKDARFFALYARYKNYAASFRSGTYALKPNQDLVSIMNSLKKGPPRERFTIPEGFTTQQIADLLAGQKLIDKSKFLELVKAHDFGYSFLKGVPQSADRLEGFLFPDTYEIEQGTSEEAIINMMLKRFEQELTPDVQQAIKNKGWTTQQFVTMASLIEREARQPEDRPIISQVFQKRLQIDMPLQSCASVQYVLGTAKPVLSLEDIQVKSPYNTYQNKGLPPGPIANPGRAALLAAAFPANTDYLYFVAKSDGYHAFAKTYAEHLRNVQKYEK